MSEELKPCPFCGKPPELTKHFKCDDYSLIHRCKVVGPISFGFGDKKRHIKTWNTRAKLSAQSVSAVQPVAVPHDVRAAVTTMFHLGVSLNDWDSKALETILLFVQSLINGEHIPADADAVDAKPLKPFTLEKYVPLTYSNGLPSQDAKKDAEIIAAAKNLVAVKGRHHSEQAYKRLAAAIAAQSTEGAKG